MRISMPAAHGAMGLSSLLLFLWVSVKLIDHPAMVCVCRSLVISSKKRIIVFFICFVLSFTL